MMLAVAIYVLVTLAFTVGMLFGLWWAGAHARSREVGDNE